MANGNEKSMESWIWDAACSIHGAAETDAETYRPIAEIVEELNAIEVEAKATDGALRRILETLGVAKDISKKNGLTADGADVRR